MPGLTTDRVGSRRSKPFAPARLSLALIVVSIPLAFLTASKYLAPSPLDVALSSTEQKQITEVCTSAAEALDLITPASTSNELMAAYGQALEVRQTRLMRLEQLASSSEKVRNKLNAVLENEREVVALLGHVSTSPEIDEQSESELQVMDADNRAYAAWMATGYPTCAGTSTLDAQPQAVSLAES